MCSIPLKYKIPDIDIYTHPHVCINGHVGFSIVTGVVAPAVYQRS